MFSKLHAFYAHANDDDRKDDNDDNDHTSVGDYDIFYLVELYALGLVSYIEDITRFAES